MARLTYDILDDCISRIQAGASVADCVKLYPRIAGLKSALRVAEMARALQRADRALNQQGIWHTISLRVDRQKTAGDENRGGMLLPWLRFGLFRSVVTVGAIVVFVGIAASTAAAARKSLPGHPLYQVKRTVEQIQLALTLDDVQKAELRLQHAEQRLTEAKVIVEQNPRSDPSAIKKTLTDLTNTTAKVAQESTDNKTLLKKVVELADKQQNVLVQIETKAAIDDTKKAITQAIDSSIETKTAAEKNLAKLETTSATTEARPAPTTTPATLMPHSSTTKEHTKPHPAPPPASTSTPETLHTFGSPSHSTTSPTFLSSPPGATGTSTPEIVPSR